MSVKLQNDISLAQWSLVEEVRAGKWSTLDFPKVARQDFDLNGIEFVNTLFEVPTFEYLKTLKQNAADENVQMVLIMVDDEGDGCEYDPKARKQFVTNHKKWIDIAEFLGCRSIRTNCRGNLDLPTDEQLQYAVESYTMLLEYASQAEIHVLVENHGGLSNDPDWMIRLVQGLNHPLFGTYPDWREPDGDFDNIEYLKKTAPFAKGMSYRNQPTEEATKEMIDISIQSGYEGWYGIESNGRPAINEGIRLLKKFLLNA